MFVFSEITWFLLGGISLSCLVTCLFVLAKYSDRERSIVDLHQRVVQLRAAHAETDEHRRSNEVIVVDEAPPEVEGIPTIVRKAA